MRFVKTVDRKVVSKRWESISFIDSEFELASALSFVYIHELLFKFLSQVRSCHLVSMWA